MLSKALNKPHCISMGIIFVNTVKYLGKYKQKVKVMSVIQTMEQSLCSSPRYSTKGATLLVLSLWQRGWRSRRIDSVLIPLSLSTSKQNGLSPARASLLDWLIGPFSFSNVLPLRPIIKMSAAATKCPEWGYCTQWRTQTCCFVSTLFCRGL